jgi:HlyD family secretion protein
MNSNVSTPASVTVTVTFNPPDTAGTQANDTPPITVAVAPAPVSEVAAATAPQASPPETTPTAPPVVVPANTTDQTAPKQDSNPTASPAETPATEAKAVKPAAPAADTPAPSFWAKWKKWLIPALIVLVLAIIGLVTWQMMRPKGPGEGFVSSNGRIEATEIDVASKFAGRLQDILVADGDFVAAGQVLGHMQVQTLEAQRDEAQAKHQQSITAVTSAEAQVAVRASDRQAAIAVVAQRDSELDAARRRLARSETLTREGASSSQELDDDRARVSNARAAVVAAQAQVQAAQAAIAAAQAQVAGARSTVDAAEATIVRVKADIDDSTLISPRAGRVQYRIAQPGEVLAAGGKVLNLVDLGDVYMTFFVVEASAGKLALGSEVHIILDAAPQYVIPAKVSFVASTAQFTPKTVETASERQKLMFRVKAQISRELLQKNLRQIKTGLPGMAWLKLDPQAEWPPELAVKVPQ